MSTEGGEGGPQPEAQRTGPEADVAQAVKTLITDKVRERGAALDNPTSPSDKALQTIRRLQEPSPSIGFPGGDTEVRFPTFDVEDDNGDTHTIDRDEYRLAGIYGSTRVEGPHGEQVDGLIASFVDADGNLMVDSDGKRVEVYLTREQVIDAQILSDQDALKGAFDADEQQVLQMHIDALPQHDSPTQPDATAVQDVVDRVASKNGMLRVADIKAFVQVLPDAVKTSAQVMAIMNGIDGSVLADPSQLMEIADIAGIDLSSMQEQLTAFDDDITKLQADLDALPDDADAATKKAIQDKIDQAGTDKAAYQQARDILQREQDKQDVLQAEAEARSPKRLIEQVNSRIQHQVDGLTASLAQLQAVDTSNMDSATLDQHNEQVRNTALLLNRLKTASFADGEALGVGLKYELIKQAVDSGTLGQITEASLRRELRVLKPLAEQTDEKLKELLEDKGVAEKKITAIQKAFKDNPISVLSLLNDPELVDHIDDLQMAIFGKKLTDADATAINGAVEDMIKSLPPEEQKKIVAFWNEYKSTAGMGLLAILALLLASPIIAAGAAVQVAGSAAGGGRG